MSFKIKRYAVVGHLPINFVHRQNVVVLHVEMATIVVLRHIGLNVVRRVDVNFTVEDVGRRVRRVDMRDQWFRASRAGQTE